MRHNERERERGGGEEEGKGKIEKGERIDEMRQNEKAKRKIKNSYSFS